MLAPICLFTYSRLSETKLTIEALKNNYLASKSDLFIFSDGPRNENVLQKVEEVRQYLKTVKGFKSINIYEAIENKGLASSIISGVSKIIKEHGSAIVVEDDLITSPNFLDFMNNSLNFYKNNNSIFSISGFSVKVEIPKEYAYDIYFWGRAHSWGWATWVDRWSTIDWEIEDYASFINNRKLQKSFNKCGSDLSKMLISAKTGKVDSWYILFNYNQFKQNRVTVYPILSKVNNNGFMSDATHTDSYNRIRIDFDKSSKIKFELPEIIEFNSDISRQVYKYKSLSYRIIGKLLTIIMKLGLITQRKTFL